MANLVIVALPAEDDYVNQISSEKVAHMTLLFLGDLNNVKNLTKIIDFTEHAANEMLDRFYMEVDRRGVLGPDQADVLFFKKTRWSGFKEINDFRLALLQEHNIRMAYDSVQNQFDEWVPHLTLGYPATPAKPDKRDYPGFWSVKFDRIAVWVKDFEGVEFLLKSDYDEVMAMGSVREKGEVFIENFLEHKKSVSISEKPWSDYTEADYTLQQWHKACLIHQHQGPPTSKDQCKLPVKTPNGVLNRNGIHAAAAALAGARGGVKASDSEKTAAAKALIRYYGQLDETPPDSLTNLADMSHAELLVTDFLAHHK